MQEVTARLLGLRGMLHVVQKPVSKQASYDKVETAKAGRHGDGRGLFLYVKPTGARSSVLRYQVSGTGATP